MVNSGQSLNSAIFGSAISKHDSLAKFVELLSSQIDPENFKSIMFGFSWVKIKVKGNLKGLGHFIIHKTSQGETTLWRTSLVLKKVSATERYLL